MNLEIEPGKTYKGSEILASLAEMKQITSVQVALLKEQRNTALDGQIDLRVELQLVQKQVEGLTRLVNLLNVEKAQETQGKESGKDGSDNAST